jgi:class 3 adenylate cyclase/tetratricopeptide (TPR) repeat protein
MRGSQFLFTSKQIPDSLVLFRLICGIVVHRLIIVVFVLCAFKKPHAQSVDGLKAQWRNVSIDDSLRFEAVYNLAWAFAYEQTDSAMVYAQMALGFAEKKKNALFKARSYNVIGSIELIRHQLGRAKEAYNKALEFASDTKDLRTLSSVHNNLGGLSFRESDYPQAQLHYSSAYEMAIRTANLSGQASALNNLAMLSEAQGDYPVALKQYKEALDIKRKCGNPTGTTLLNIGNVYQAVSDVKNAAMFYGMAIDTLTKAGDAFNLSDAYSDLAGLKVAEGDYASGHYYYDKCIQISKELGSESAVVFAMHEKGLAYLEQKEYALAKTHCLESARMSRELNDLENLSIACKCLHETYRATGDFRNALVYHEQFVQATDSLRKLKNLDELTKLSIQHDYQLRALKDSLSREEEKIKTDFAYRVELDRKKNERNLFIALAVFVFLLAIVLANRLWFSVKTRGIIQLERERSEKLLLNILPSSVAAELKSKGSSEASLYSEITILFTDFSGFSSLSEKLSAPELIHELDTCFRAFDQIVLQHGLEKIKTIGDSYMAVAGLPRGNAATAADAVLAAIEMMRFIEQRYEKKQQNGEHGLRMRAGLHTGDVVAGVVGHSKFQFDIWGDSVNIASRIESSGEPGRVNISAVTQGVISKDDRFSFISRGKIAVKNKGEIEMFFVETRSDVDS